MPLTQELFNDLVLIIAKGARKMMIETQECPHTGFLVPPSGGQPIAADFGRLARMARRTNPELKDRDVTAEELWIVMGIGAKLVGARGIVGVHDVRVKPMTKAEFADAERGRAAFKQWEIADNPDNPEAIIVVGKAPGLKPPVCMMQYTRKRAFVKGEQFGSKIEFAEEKPRVTTDVAGRWLSMVPDFWNLDINLPSFEGGDDAPAE